MGQHLPKKLLRYALLLLLSATFSVRAIACHFAAADIIVKYAGPKSGACTAPVNPSLDYEVYLIVYNACSDCHSEVGGSVNIQIGSEEGGIAPQNYLFVDTLFKDYGQPGAVAPPATVIHSLCPNFDPVNSCITLANAKTYPAYKKKVFKFFANGTFGNITLPSRQRDWVFRSPSFGARNTSNWFNCSSMYVEALLNNVDRPEGSAPMFTEDPLPYICVNQPYSYLNGPLNLNVDTQQDSMRVDQQVPYRGFDQPCGYIPGFSTSDPVGSSSGNPYKLNPFTGTATFTPIVQGPKVLAFRVNLYEKKTGKLLGYAYRDVMVSVLPCDAPPPPIDTLPVNIAEATIIETPVGKAVFVCPGSNMSFDVNSTSTPGNTLYMYATNATIGGSTFTIANNGTDNVTGTFSWTPGTSDMGDHPLTIQVHDSTCIAGQAIILKSSQSILIRVVPGIDAGADLPICKLNPTERQLFVLGTDNISVNWTDIDGGAPKDLSATDIHNPTAKPSETAVYVVTTPDLKGSCKVKDTVSVYIDTSNTIDVFPQNPVVLCKPDYLQLDGGVTGTGPITNMACGLNNSTINPPCGKGDSITIFGSPVYGRISLDDDKSPDVPLLPNNVRTSKLQFLIRKDELREWGMNSNTLNSISFELQAPDAPSLPQFYDYNNFSISVKCTNLTELKAGAGFESGMVNVYTSPGVISLTGTQWRQFPFNSPYNWDTTKNLLVEICYSNNANVESACNNSGGNAPFLKYANTTYASTLSLSPKVFYIDAVTAAYIPDTNATAICGVLKNEFVAEKKARPVFGFTYCSAPSLPFDIKWMPGTLLSDSTILQPLAYVPKSAKYILESYGRSGCLLRDSVDIYIPVHDFSVGPKDSSICLGETAPLWTKNGFTAIWHEYKDGEYKPATSLSCTDCFNPIASPKETTTYKVELSDSTWCFDTLEVTVKVLPLPDVQILTRDTIVKYGRPLQLQVKGARTYNWMPPSTLNNANISYPIATPTEPTDYIVGGIGSNGCRSYDTVRVGIDYRDNLLIPSGFTPNGDGKNDVFRIANMTFQRVMEFRVFNRWGQEVFTGNSNTGWDGKWKGVPQDMGNYQYLIRLGYPDGFVETYKGEVTLIK